MHNIQDALISKKSYYRNATELSSWEDKEIVYVLVVTAKSVHVSIASIQCTCIYFIFVFYANVESNYRYNAFVYLYE